MIAPQSGQQGSSWDCVANVTTGRAKLEKQSYHLRSGSPAVLTSLDFCFSLAEKRIFGLPHLPINNGVIQTSCAALSFLPAASAGKRGQEASGCFPFSKIIRDFRLLHKSEVRGNNGSCGKKQEEISCHGDTVFFHPNSQRFWTSLANNIVLLDFSSTICDLIQKFTSCSPWGILHFLQQEVLQRRYEGESRDLTGGKVGVIAEAFKMCHDLREAMTRLSSDKPPRYQNTTCQGWNPCCRTPTPPPSKKPRQTSLVETKTQVPYKHNGRET